ncbi:pentatricopeptide repeat-containing protein [Tanacetum coccineum]
MYIKCSNINYAHKVFDKMPQSDAVSYNGLVFGYAGIGNMGMARMIHVRDVVLWNSLLTGYLQNGSCWKCVDVFMSIRREDVKIDATAFLCRLEDYRLGVHVHGLIVRMGFLNKGRECDCGYSALIAGCVQNDEYLDGLKLFKDMRREEGLGVSQSLYASVFRSFAGLSALRFGSQLHGHSLKMNYGSDTIVETATLEMYAKCGRLCDAKKLFHKLSIHNLQSYNAIIIGCACVDQGLEALQLFHNLMNTNLGFDDITLSENAILDMYGICGALAEARSVFGEMQIRDVVSWNAIIAAYEQNGNVDETLHVLVWMLSSGLEPDEFTFDSVLKACAGLQSLNDGSSW